MAELSPEFIATAKRMGVPLPPRHRRSFLGRWLSIDWTGALTADRALTEVLGWRRYHDMNEQQQDALRKASAALQIPIPQLLR